MSKEAVVSGDIVTTNGDISGKIQGGLKASGKVSLSSSAILEGDLSASILVVQNGAIFNGMCIMNNKKKNILNYIRNVLRVDHFFNFNLI